MSNNDIRTQNKALYKLLSYIAIIMAIKYLKKGLIFENAIWNAYG